MTYKLSEYHIASEILPNAGQANPARLVYATRTGTSARLDDTVFQKMKEGDFEGLSTPVLMSLFKLELIVPQDEDEFQTILGRNRHATNNAKDLSVVIQPTANCQLGCHYCGQSHKKVNADDALSAKIVSRIRDNLDRGSYKRLAVEWYGGEPLMAYRNILSLSDELISACNDRDVAYSAHMITNGLSLKPAVAKQLIARKCRDFQITLDGTEKTHDKLRMTKTGQSTFNLILRNIIEVSSMEEFEVGKCSIVVRMNVNRLSSPEVSELIDLLASHGLQHRRVGLDFQPVVDWGGNGAASESHEHDDFANLEIGWIIQAMRYGFQVAPILPKRQTKPCMVVEPDGEVYDAEGNVWPCYEFPYTDMYADDAYKLGHIDRIAHGRNDAAITRGWFSDIETNISPCPTCRLFPVCGGGCPKKWLQGEGSCPPFKRNMQDRIALDYLLRKSGIKALGTASIKNSETV